MLEISTTKIVHAIAYAREHDDSAGSWDSRIQRGFQEELGNAILDAFAAGNSRGAFAEFISSLNKDEQASLLAIAWVGRGTFLPENLNEAFLKAKAEHVEKDDDYLLGLPLLAEYLVEGMEKLGYPIAEFDVVRRSPES